MKTRLTPAHSDSRTERQEVKAEQNFGQIGTLKRRFDRILNCSIRNQAFYSGVQNGYGNRNCQNRPATISNAR